jgi:hypothetical protein
MAAKDLIGLSRAYANIQGQTQGGPYDSLISTLITAYSDAIEKYCRRRFVSHFFDELYNGSGEKRLLLRQYPIQSVQSVRYRYVMVAKVINNDPTNVQARVAVSNTGLVLTRTNDGVATSSTVPWAGNTTLLNVLNSVTALGNGWVGQVVGDPNGDYGAWPASDLYIPGSYGDSLEGSGIQQSQGALGARGQYAGLMMHTYELQGCQWDARGWLLRAIPYTDPELTHPEDLVWPPGINNFRIQYTAGYSTVPEAVQEACARWVAYAFYLTQRDPALVSSVPTSGASSGWLPTTNDLPPYDVAALLAPYRRHTVATNQG